MESRIEINLLENNTTFKKASFKKASFKKASFKKASFFSDVSGVIIAVFMLSCLMYLQMQISLQQRRQRQSPAAL
jgi:hypothetical protein